MARLKKNFKERKRRKLPHWGEADIFWCYSSCQLKSETAVSVTKKRLTMRIMRWWRWWWRWHEGCQICTSLMMKKCQAEVSGEAEENEDGKTKGLWLQSDGGKRSGDIRSLLPGTHLQQILSFSRDFHLKPTSVMGNNTQLHAVGQD